MDIKPGHIVKSLAGRDCGRLFVVTGVLPNFAYLADGRLRRAEKPKLKKLRHIALVGQAGGGPAQRLAAGERITNSEIRRMLLDIRASAGLNFKEV